MAEPLKYCYYPSRTDCTTLAQDRSPLFREKYPVRIIWLDGRPVRAQRIAPVRFGTVWEQIAYWFRSLFGLEGGRSWAIGSSDARSLSAQLKQIEEVAPPSSTVRSVASRSVRRRATPLAASRIDADALAMLWKLVCRFLAPRDVLALATASRFIGRSVASQALVSRAYHRASALGCLSALHAVLHDVAAWRDRQDPQWPVPTGAQVAVLKALAENVEMLLPEQRPAACMALVEALRHIPERQQADLPAVIASAVNRLTAEDVVRDLDGHTLAVRLLALTTGMARERQYPVLFTLLCGDRTEVAKRAIKALDCTADNWLCAVRELPPSAQPKAVEALGRALLGGKPAGTNASPASVATWEAMLGCVDRLDADHAALKAHALEALASTAFLAMHQDPNAVRWHALFERACLLPALHVEAVMHRLRCQFDALPDPAACIAAFRSWLDTAALSVAQKVRLGVALMDKLPMDDGRRTFWESLWDDWRRGAYDNEAQSLQVAGRLINILWLVAGQANWPAPLFDSRHATPLPPTQCATLLSMFPIWGLQSTHAAHAVLQRSWVLAEQENAPMAALKWYADGRVTATAGYRHRVEKIIGALRPAPRCSLLYQAIQGGDFLSKHVLQLVMAQLQSKPASADQAALQSRLAAELARYWHQRLATGTPFDLLHGELKQLTAVLLSMEPTETRLAFGIGMAVLGNTAAMSATMRREHRKGDMAAAEQMVMRIWNWIGKTPPPMQMQILQAMVQHVGASVDDAEDYYARWAISTLQAVVRTARALTIEPRGDLLLALADTRKRVWTDRTSPRWTASFDAICVDMWQLLRRAVPAQHRVRMLAKAAVWLTDVQADSARLPAWQECVTEYLTLSDGLADVDKACIDSSLWRLREKQCAASGPRS